MHGNVLAQCLIPAPWLLLLFELKKSDIAGVLDILQRPQGQEQTQLSRATPQVRK